MNYVAMWPVLHPELGPQLAQGLPCPLGFAWHAVETARAAGAGVTQIVREDVLTGKYPAAAKAWESAQVPMARN